MRRFSARSRWRWRLQGVAGNRIWKFTKKSLFPNFGKRLFVFVSNVLPICAEKYRQTDCLHRVYLGGIVACIRNRPIFACAPRDLRHRFLFRWCRLHIRFRFYASSPRASPQPANIRIEKSPPPQKLRREKG